MLWSVMIPSQSGLFGERFGFLRKMTWTGGSCSIAAVATAAGYSFGLLGLAFEWPNWPFMPINDIDHVEHKQIWFSLPVFLWQHLFFKRLNFPTRIFSRFSLHVHAMFFLRHYPWTLSQNPLHFLVESNLQGFHQTKEESCMSHVHCAANSETKNDESWWNPTCP